MVEMKDKWKCWKIMFNENDWKTKRILLSEFYEILKENLLTENFLDSIQE